MADTTDDDWGELLGDVSGPVPIGKPRKPLPTVVSAPIPPRAMARVPLVKRLKRTPATGSKKRSPASPGRATESVLAVASAAVPTAVPTALPKRDERGSPSHTRRFRVPIPPDGPAADEARLGDDVKPITLTDGVPTGVPAAPSWQQGDHDSGTVERVSEPSGALQIPDFQSGVGNTAVPSEASNAMSLGPLVVRTFAPITVPHAAVPQGSVVGDDVDPDPEQADGVAERSPPAVSRRPLAATEAGARAAAITARLDAVKPEADAHPAITQAEVPVVKLDSVPQQRAAKARGREYVPQLATPAARQSGLGPMLPWLLGGAAVLGLAAVLWGGSSGGDDPDPVVAASASPATPETPGSTPSETTPVRVATPIALDAPTAPVGGTAPVAVPTPTTPVAQPIQPPPVASVAAPADSAAYRAAVVAHEAGPTPATLEAVALAACAMEDGVKARSAFRKLRGSDYRSRVMIGCRKVEIDVTAKGDEPTATELVRKAKRALDAGDHKTATKLARAANRAEGSAAARLLMALAACKGGDLERAAALQRHVARSDRKAFAASCPALDSP